MLILQVNVVVVIEICGQGGQAQRREQRIFDRPPIRALGFCERGQYELYFHV
jgi:hypothetical protein